MPIKLKLVPEVEARIRAEAATYNVTPEELITRRLLLAFPTKEEQKLLQMKVNASGLHMQKMEDGGVLCVTSEGWEIRYTVPLSSWREDKISINILKGEEIENFMNAVEEAWKEMQRLKTSLPSGGTFATKTNAGIDIRIGVKKSSINLPLQKRQITTYNEVVEILDQCLAAKERAGRVMDAWQYLL